MSETEIGPMSSHWPDTEKPGNPDCDCCHGTGVRDVWVIDGWSFTDCLCKYGWTIDDAGRWQAPAGMVL